MSRVAHVSNTSTGIWNFQGFAQLQNSLRNFHLEILGILRPDLRLCVITWATLDCRDSSTRTPPLRLLAIINKMKACGGILCILAILTVASAARLISTNDLELPGLGDAPDFCHGLECPPFKLLQNTSNYQLREYEGGEAPTFVALSKTCWRIWCRRSVTMSSLHYMLAKCRACRLHSASFHAEGA